MDSTSRGMSFAVFKGSKDGKLVQSTTHRDGLASEEVLLRVTHSSLCGTDEHYLHADMCLGHEGAGVVEELGPNVKTLKMYVGRDFHFRTTACLHFGSFLAPPGRGES